MLRKLTIQNFRAFSHLTLTGLERINLIAGKNNSGKTALLEAIHLFSHPSNCALPGLVNEQRGIKKQDLLNSGWLFQSGDNSRVIELEAEEAAGRVRTLSIKLAEGISASSSLPYSEVAKLFRDHLPAELWLSPTPRIIYFHRDDHGDQRYTIGVQANSGLLFTGSRLSPVRPSILVTSQGKIESGLNNYAASQNELFSELEAAGRQQELIAVLRHLEPHLDSLVLLTFGGETLIHGKMAHQRPVPIPLMGEGFQRLLFISLVIAMRKGGIVLIDEIENGLHYSVLPTVWKAIAEAARNSDVQVFATTHSWECIRSAHEAFSENEPYDFRLIRLDRENGNVTGISYDHDMIETALLTGLEMR